MARFAWFDNDNMNYGGIVAAEIDTSVGALADPAAFTALTRRAANQNDGGRQPDKRNTSRRFAMSEITATVEDAL